MGKAKKVVKMMTTDVEIAAILLYALKIIVSVYLIDYIVLKLWNRRAQIKKEKELQEKVCLLTKEVKRVISESNKEIMSLYKHQNYIYLLEKNPEVLSDPKDIVKTSELEFMYFKVLTSKNSISKPTGTFSNVQNFNHDNFN